MKDRGAFGMIKGALDRGEVRVGSKIVETTSGNTGIALAVVGKMLGIEVTLIMPDTAAEERKRTMKAYEAILIETPGAKIIEYSRELAEKMSIEEDYHLLNQFANSDNYKVHYRTTGPEIWKDIEGDITHFVSSMENTGTIVGVSRYLKEMNSDIQIIECQLTDGSRIPGIRRWSLEFLSMFYE